jgi:hypothetical protein
MIINIEISRGELYQVDSSTEELEEIVWEMVGNAIDPMERLDVDLNITVYD